MLSHKQNASQKDRTRTRQQEETCLTLLLGHGPSQPSHLICLKAQVGPLLGVGAGCIYLTGFGAPSLQSQASRPRGRPPLLFADSRFDKLFSATVAGLAHLAGLQRPMWKVITVAFLERGVVGARSCKLRSCLTRLGDLSRSCPRPRPGSM